LKNNHIYDVKDLTKFSVHLNPPEKS